MMTVKILKQILHLIHLTKMVLKLNQQRKRLNLLHPLLPMSFWILVTLVWLSTLVMVNTIQPKLQRQFLSISVLVVYCMLIKSFRIEHHVLSFVLWLWSRIGGSSDTRIYTVVFKGYDTTELVTASEIRPVTDPKKRSLVENEQESDKDRKRKKNEKKTESKAAKAAEQMEKQKSWQSFAKKSVKKGVHIPGIVSVSFQLTFCMGFFLSFVLVRIIGRWIDVCVTW